MCSATQNQTKQPSKPKGAYLLKPRLSLLKPRLSLLRPRPRLKLRVKPNAEHEEKVKT